MKTPMQEHIEWLKKEKDEHGYEKHPYFECAIEHAEAMLVKERAFYWLRPKDAVSSCDAIFEEASKVDIQHQREMKTPMQELLENIDLFISQGMSYSEWKKLTYSGKTSIERYLDIEKSFLIKTHGNKKVYDSQIDPTIVTGEEWYNKTFNTKDDTSKGIN